MDTLYLVIVGAIGWTGFIGCVWVLKSRYRLNFQFIEETHRLEVKTHVDSAVTASSENTIWGNATASFPQTIIEPEIPEEMHRLAEMAEPLLDQYDTVPQSGEWKRHQVYAAMLKNPKVKEIIGDDKWKAGFALELAVAQRRMNAEEVVL